MKYGSNHGNYKHGGYCHSVELAHLDVKQALAKDLLIRVMTTKCDASGKAPFSNDEQTWALRVVNERPDWARDTLRNLGFGDDYYEGGAA